MKKGGVRYKVPLRRRGEGKTDYSLRYKLVISGKPRFVVRKTNKYISIQVIKFDIDGDKVIVAAHSKELSKTFDWKGYWKNLCAAYLTGYLAALRARQKGIKEAILDIGLQQPIRGNRVFASLKGAIDAGLEIPHNEDILPPEERINCKILSKWASELKEKDPEYYKRQFSAQLQRLPPEELAKHFLEVLDRIKKQSAGMSKENVELGEKQ
ncbi:MAG: 50S ribosomal protein L18 [Caldisphaeraceae archaeon]|nr:50S ribosomal protein L18 [Caldisphaeraceae archaeon]